MLSVRGMRCTSPDLFTDSNVFQYGAADRGGRYNMIPVTACWSRTAPAAYCIYTILKHTDCIETVHPSTWKGWVHSRGVAYALVCFNMVGALGFEPRIGRLKVCCDTLSPYSQRSLIDRFTKSFVALTVRSRFSE